MKIRIIDNNHKYTDEFLDFLIQKIRDKFTKDVKIEKLEPFEIYINELPRYKSIFKKYMPAYEICLMALYNIVVIKYDSSYVLKIDETQKIPQTNIKIIEICKLINNGNIMLKAYPIFTDVFKYVQTHVENYYAEYVLGEN